MLPSPEKECPECKGPLSWKVVRGTYGNPLYNGLCSKCNIILRGRETPDVTKGRALAHELIGVNCMDKKITKLSGDVQLGILRERMHCSTCDKPTYPIQSKEDDCLCDGCDCLFCREKKDDNP